MKITRAVLPEGAAACSTWMGPEEPKQVWPMAYPLVCDLEENENLEVGLEKIEDKVQELLAAMYRVSADPVEALVIYRFVPYVEVSSHGKKIITIVSMVLGPEDKLVAYPSDPKFTERDYLPEYLCKAVKPELT